MECWSWIQSIKMNNNAARRWSKRDNHVNVEMLLCDGAEAKKKSLLWCCSAMWPKQKRKHKTPIFECRFMQLRLWASTRRQRRDHHSFGMATHGQPSQTDHYIHTWWLQAFQCADQRTNNEIKAKKISTIIGHDLALGENMYVMCINLGTNINCIIREKYIFTSVPKARKANWHFIIKTTFPYLKYIIIEFVVPKLIICVHTWA